MSNQVVVPNYHIGKEKPDSYGGNFIVAAVVDFGDNTWTMCHDRVIDSLTWCVDNAQGKYVGIIETPNNPTFYFENTSDAVMFKLTWLGSI